MRTLVLAAIVAASIPLSAAALPTSGQVVVTAHPITVDEWRGKVARRLTDSVRLPLTMGTSSYTGGISAVRFRCDERGRPVALTLVRRSGSPVNDRAAMSAIRRMGSLAPMPMGIARDQRFRANVIFAQNQEDYDDSVATLAREARRERIAGTQDRTVMALNSVPGALGGQVSNKH
ncbi:MAG: TonB family protein [Sphingomonas sp.]